MAFTPFMEEYGCNLVVKPLPTLAPWGTSDGQDRDRTAQKNLKKPKILYNIFKPIVFYSVNILKTN
jgi:hypothetical protein